MHRIYQDPAQYRRSSNYRHRITVDDHWVVRQMVRSYRICRKAGLSPWTARSVVWYPAWCAAINKVVAESDQGDPYRAGGTNP